LHMWIKISMPVCNALLLHRGDKYAFSILMEITCRDVADDRLAPPLRITKGPRKNNFPFYPSRLQAICARSERAQSSKERAIPPVVRPQIEQIWPKSGRLKCGNYFCAGLKGIRVLAAGVLIAVLIGCGARPDIVRQRRYEAVGLASYYGGKLHGRRTASGERYDVYDLTAAHPVLKFGSRVEVTNLKNGRKVRVRINDRGPFRKGRIIDLSYAAAKKIGMLTRGLVRVRVRLLNE
jgi:rare lipoprotein A